MQAQAATRRCPRCSGWGFINASYGPRGVARLDPRRPDKAFRPLGMKVGCPDCHGLGTLRG